jgi:hypothetical protein
MKRFLPRNKFDGPQADLKTYVYGLCRQGVPYNILASGGLTLSRVKGIIAEGNGGKLPTLLYTCDEGDGIAFYRRDN